MNREEIDCIILTNVKLAEKIAKIVQNKYKHLSFDELLSAAYMGLVQAANSYKPEKNQKFQYFALKRIYGAIKDYSKELFFFSKINRSNEEPNVGHTYNEKKDDLFIHLTSCLNNSEKQVVYKYYFIGDNTREIGESLELNQSRISQILSNAENKMRIFWSDKKEELYECLI